MTALQAQNAAEAAGDYDRALRHGWAALGLASGDPAREAELLVNLASVCGLAGSPTAAIHAYLTAAHRVAEPRVRVPALAGAAVDAATLGDMRLLRALTAVLRPELAVTGLPYETARGWMLLARAWAAATRRGDVRGEEEVWSGEFTAAARAVAEQHGFHELVHELEHLAVPPVRHTPGTLAVPDRGSASPQDGTAAPASAVATARSEAMSARVGHPDGAIRSARARAVVAALADLPIGAPFAVAGPQARAQGRVP